MDKVIVIKKIEEGHYSNWEMVIHVVNVDTDKDISILEAEYDVELLKKKKLNPTTEYTFMDYIQEFYRYRKLEFSEFTEYTE